MKKRILSILLTLCMVLMLCPVTALANDDATELQNLLNIAANISDRTAKLTRDYTIDTPLQVSYHVTLDLNGHVIKMTGNGSVFQLIGTGLSLTLQDSDPDAKHDGLPDGGVITRANSADHGGGVYVAKGGSFIMEGGTIYNCRAEHGGGGVCVVDSLFTMSGGAIRDCSAMNGGGVLVSGGSFTMSGGAIRDCSAMNGGGVAVFNGSFTMSGGAIYDCSAATGGGVAVFNGSFTMEGGTIRDCSANSGGVYINRGSFTMSGGICYDDISGNMDIKGKTVTFKNGDSKYALEVVADGKTVVAPTEPDAPEGKKFAGWYTDEACTIPYYFDAPVTQSITLYAGFEPAPGTLLGDVNGDGVVDGNDAVLLQKHLEGLEILTGEQLAVADFNGDGEVNYSDLTKLQRQLDVVVSAITVCRYR